MFIIVTVNYGECTSAPDSPKLMPGQQTYDTRDEAFAAVARLNKRYRDTKEAYMTLEETGDPLLFLLGNPFRRTVEPDFRVYELTEVSRVDVSTLPKLD